MPFSLSRTTTTLAVSTALAAAAAAVCLGAPSTDVDWEAAKALFSKGRWRDADAALTLYAKRVPPPAHRAEALVLAGRCREKQRDTAGARKLYEKVARDDSLRRAQPFVVADAYDRLHALHLAAGTAAPTRWRLVDEAARRIAGTAALGRILEREGDARLALSDFRGALSAYGAAPSLTPAGTNALSLLRGCAAVGAPPLSDRDLVRLASVAEAKPDGLAPLCGRLSKRGDGWKAENFLAADHLANGRAREAAALWDGMLRGSRGPADRIAFSKARALLACAPDEGLAALDEWLCAFGKSPLRERVEAFRVEAVGRHGDPERAVALADEFLADHPGSKLAKGVETARAMARGAMKRKAQLAAEIAAQDEALRDDPDLARVVKAEALFESGRTDAAARAFLSFRNQPRHPLWGRAWFGLGRARLAKGDAKGALEVWDEVWRRSLVSTNVAFAAESRRAAGDVWLEDFGDPERALEAYTEAAARNPDVSDDAFAMNRGLALLALDRADDARTVFVERRDRDGLDMAEFVKWDNMAKLCLAGWQPPNGGKRPDRRARVDFTLAEGLLAGGMAERALRLYARARAGLPADDGGDRCALGEALCLAALGRHRDALRGYAEFRTRLAKSPEAPRALLYGGILCASPAVGDFRAARRWFAEAARMRPGSPEAVAAEFYDATLAWLSRDWREAERLHSGFAARHPDSPLAKVALEERLPAIAAKSLEAPLHNPVDDTIEVEVKPKDRKRRAIRIEKATAYNAHLIIKPADGWVITKSEIRDQDSRTPAKLWTGPNPALPTAHTYHLCDAFSSQEYVMIEGWLAKPAGGGGSPRNPNFRVTVPSVDVDWEGLDGPNDEKGNPNNDEDGEETRHVVVPLNRNDDSDVRHVLLQSPFDDDERQKSKDDPTHRPPFQYGEPVEPTITLDWRDKNFLSLVRVKGNVRTIIDKAQTIKSKEHDTPWEWPLRFEVLPLQTNVSFQIFAEGQADEVGQKAVDRIRGRIVDVDIDVDSDYDGDIDADDEPLEETQGGFICTGGDHLARIPLAIAPQLTELPGKLTLTATKGDNLIRVWEDEARTTEIKLPAVWTNAVPVPATLYAEGLGASAAMRDIELTLEYDDNPKGSDKDLFKCRDKIALTVIDVDLIGYAAWRGLENYETAVSEDEELYPGFLVTTENSDHIMARLTFKKIPLVSDNVVRSFKVSRGGFAYFDGVLTTDIETPIQGSEDKSFIVCMRDPLDLNDENFSSVDIEYIVRHRNGAIIGRDKCRLLRPYVVAIGDSLTYGVWQYARNRSICTMIPTWKINPKQEPYPGKTVWEDPNRVTPPDNVYLNRLNKRYQGYRGYLAEQLPGFTWLGIETGGHGPRHNGYPGEKSSKIFARLDKTTLSMSPSYTFILFLAGMNDCNRDKTNTTETINFIVDAWTNTANSIVSARAGKGRTLFLPLQVPIVKSNDIFHNFNFDGLTAYIHALNGKILTYEMPKIDFITLRVANTQNILHATMLPGDNLSDDGMHFDNDGYETMAQRILQSIEGGLE